jgi:hypothetical protein
MMEREAGRPMKMKMKMKTETKTTMKITKTTGTKTGRRRHSITRITLATRSMPVVTDFVGSDRIEALVGYNTDLLLFQFAMFSSPRRIHLSFRNMGMRGVGMVTVTGSKR